MARFRFAWTGVALAALAAVAWSAVPAGAVGVDNGVYSIEVVDQGAEQGQWSMGTGPSYGDGKENVRLIYNHPDQSYAETAVKSYTSGNLYAHRSAFDEASGTYPYALGLHGNGTYVQGDRIVTGYWLDEGEDRLEVTQTLAVGGDDARDGYVRLSLRVCNQADAAAQVGVRSMWDIKVGDLIDDGPHIAWIAADGSQTPFSDETVVLDHPAHLGFNVTDYSDAGEQIGTVWLKGVLGDPGTFRTPVSVPDRVAYWNWTDVGAWALHPDGAGIVTKDSAMVLYWGYHDPITIASGDCHQVETYAVTGPYPLPPGPGTSANDPPTFHDKGDVAADEDAGLVVVEDWAYNIRMGPDDEAGQAGSFTTDVPVPSGVAFAVAPFVEADGDLVFRTADDACGVARILVRLRDDGGTDGGGRNTSAAHEAFITVRCIDDPPSFTPADVMVLEDSGTYDDAWATDISMGPGETGGPGSFVVTVDTNAALFDQTPTAMSDGRLSLRPATDACGTSAVTAVLYEDAEGEGLASDPETFTVTVTCVNDPPSFMQPSARTYTVPDPAPQKTAVGWATGMDPGPEDEDGQVMHFTVEVTSIVLAGGGVGDPASFFQALPGLDPAGTLRFRTADGMYGTFRMEVCLHDDGGDADGGIDQTCHDADITVRSMNTPPRITAGGLVEVAEDSGPYSHRAQSGTAWAAHVHPAQSPADDAAESWQTLTFHPLDPPSTLLAAQAVLVPGPLPEADLLFTPAPDRFGTVAGSLCVQDDGGAGSGESDRTCVSATIRITPVNDPPVAHDDTVAGWEDEPLSIPSATLLANDEDTECTLSQSTHCRPWSVTVAQGPAHGSLSTTDDGDLVYTPAPDFWGSDSFSYLLHDNDPEDPRVAEGHVTVQVRSVNDAPTAAEDYLMVRPGRTNRFSAQHDLLRNDADPEGEAMEVVVVEPPGRGTLRQAVDGTLEYTPFPDTTDGVDYFHYYAQDARGGRSNIVPVNLRIQENVPPHADFGFDPELPRVGTPVEFADRSRDPDVTGIGDRDAPSDARVDIQSWWWDLGDGATSRERSPVHVYREPGLYTVTLTVRDHDGAVATVSKSLPVMNDAAGGLEADGAPSPATAASGQNVLLVGSAQGPYIDHRWEQVDGPEVPVFDADRLQAAFNAPFIDASAGFAELTFRLVVTDGRGGQASKDVVVTVMAPGVDPRVVAGADQEATVGSQVGLLATASGFGDAATVLYGWRQLEGPPVGIVGSPVPRAGFRVPPAPDGTVLLFEVTATDGRLRSPPDLLQVTVLDAGAQAGITATPVEEGFLFSPPLEGRYYSWDFGDGTTSHRAGPLHAFPAPGTYDVRLTVTAEDGTTATYAREVWVPSAGEETSSFLADARKVAQQGLPYWLALAGMAGLVTVAFLIARRIERRRR